MTGPEAKPFLEGYSNPSLVFPTALVAVVSEGLRSHFVIYPGGIKEQVQNDPRTFEDFKPLNPLVNTLYKNDSILYGIREGHILIGTPEFIRRRLSEHLERTDLDDIERDSITEFVNNQQIVS